MRDKKRKYAHLSADADGLMLRERELGLGVDFDALHRGKKIFMQKKRVKFFWGTFIVIFLWEWFPEYIAP